ncbi:MAG: response regulator [Pseudomonadota bacterium]
MANDNMKILLVDDEPDITYIVEFVLSSAGFEVTHINDSRQAMSELESNKYTLLMLDLMMPHIDGFTLLEQIRKKYELDELKVVILSSRHLSGEETSTLSTLKAVVMAKPFEPHRLLEKVRETIAE